MRCGDFGDFGDFGSNCGELRKWEKKWGMTLDGFANTYKHKRLRENIWQIPPGPGNEDWEFEKAWEEADSDLNSDDFEIMREENEILAASTAG
jgi:hypothetical protein